MSVSQYGEIMDSEEMEARFANYQGELQRALRALKQGGHIRCSVFEVDVYNRGGYVEALGFAARPSLEASVVCETVVQRLMQISLEREQGLRLTNWDAAYIEDIMEQRYNRGGLGDAWSSEVSYCFSYADLRSLAATAAAAPKQCDHTGSSDISVS